MTVRIIKHLNTLCRRDGLSMKFLHAPSRESAVNGLKSLKKLRIKVTHGSILTFSALLLILFVAFTVRVLPLRWEIETGSLHLSEFDPYYQYSLMKYMVDNGLVSPYYPTQWVDYQRWYPGGINMGQSLASLPMTAAFFYDIVSALGVNVDTMSFASLMPAIMGTLAVFIMYFLGKDMGGKPVGLLSALFLALSASVIQRTSLGFFDTETVGILSLVAFSLLFLRAIEEDRPLGSSIKYSIGAAVALTYFVCGWGAAYYIIGLTVLYVVVLLLLKRYSQRLLLSYSITFGLGLGISINLPYLSSTYLTSFAVLPVAGVFLLLCLAEVTGKLTSARSKVLLVALLLTALVVSFVALWQFGYLRSIAGKFFEVINPFGRASNPLVESVAEHRISGWGSIYYDVGIAVIFFIVGLYFVARNPNNRNLFLILFGLTTLYFAGSMIRLLALLAPAFSILAAIGTIWLLKPFYTLLQEQHKIIPRKFELQHVGNEFSLAAVFLIFLILTTNLAFAPLPGGVPRVFRQAYTPVTITVGSLPIAPNQPVREWFEALKYLNDFHNSSIVVCSWWDYGYWLSLIGNVTSLADNATINATQIENVGFVFMANETQSVKMLKAYNAQYILVFVTIDTDGNLIGWGDEGKWTWMARISGEAQERFISEGLIDRQDSWANESTFGSFNQNQFEWNDFGQNATIYKLMNYGRERWLEDQKSGGTPTTVLEHFSEAYFAGGALSSADAISKYPLATDRGLVPLILVYKIDYPP
jgi:dolichyl-diphosphooligosaccharide--protein glycosyltransferase